MCVNVAARPLDDGWLAAGSAEAAAALARFDQEFCLGSVNLAACFGQALKSFRQSAAAAPPGALRRRRRRYRAGRGQGEAQPGVGPRTRRSPRRVAERAGTSQRRAAGAAGAAGPRDRRTGVRRGGQSRRGARAARMAVGGVAQPATHRQGRGRRGRRRGLVLSLRLAARSAVGDPRPHRRYGPRAPEADHPQRRQAGHAGPRVSIDPKRDDVFLGRLWAQRKLDGIAPGDGRCLGGQRAPAEDRRPVAEVEPAVAGYGLSGIGIGGAILRSGRSTGSSGGVTGSRWKCQGRSRCRRIGSGSSRRRADTAAHPRRTQSKSRPR